VTIGPQRSPGRERLHDGLTAAGQLALYLGLAVMVRWPLSRHTGALSLDPNTPLHTLVMENLYRYGALSPVYMVDFPDGHPIQIIGVPFILLAAAARALLETTPAFNVAVTLMVALQGVSAAWLARRLGWRVRGQLVSGVAAIACPYLLHVAGNGQYENLAFPALALAAAGGLSDDRRVGGALGFFGLLLAGFSSPYQAVSAGMLLVLCAAWTGRRQLAVALLASALAGAPVTAYYLAAIDASQAETSGMLAQPSSGGDGERVGMVASAGVFDLITPRALFMGRTLPLDAPAERLARLSEAPARARAGPHWLFADTPQASYLGLALILMGLAGAGVCWRERWSRGAGSAGVLGAVFALGPKLTLWSGGAGAVALPWAWLSLLPVLGSLSVTYRFLAAPSFFLVMGAGALAHRAPWPAAPALAALLLADGLLRAPAPWPVQARTPALELPDGVQIDGPVALWPPADALAPQHVHATALSLGQPMALYWYASGETPEAWLEGAREAGVTGLVAFDGLAPAEVEVPLARAAGSCQHAICWWSLE